MLNDIVQKSISAAISALVVLVMVGAAKIVWDGATTVQEKVDNATSDLKSLVTVLQDEILKLKTKDNELVESINKLKELKPVEETNPVPSAEEYPLPEVAPQYEEESAESFVPEPESSPIQQEVAVPKIEQLPEKNFLHDMMKTEKMKW